MKNLKNLREDQGLSQIQCAKELDLPKTTYQYYEQERSEPSIKTIIKIADFFGCSVDYLLGHQTANTLQLEGLTDDQKQLIAIVQKLDARQTAFAIGYFSDMLGLSYAQVRPTRPF